MAPELTPLMLERARVRDLLRYYTPDANRSPAPKKIQQNETDLDAAECATEPFAVAPSSDGGPDDTKLLQHDATLAAFTQLGAFRLNCSRCFISLMDHDTQYIIAESTRSVSINDPDSGRGTSGDTVFLGPRMLDFNWGVCPNTIQVFTQIGNSLDIDTANVQANRDSYVMNDLSAIEQYKNRAYVVGWPHMRFYAEVPIHSPAGYVLGTLCAVDDKPRDGLNKAGLDALNEIACAVMKHLAVVREHQNLKRSAEMIKGLGLFTDGKSSVQEWWPHDLSVTFDGLKSSAISSDPPFGTARTLPSEPDQMGNPRKVSSVATLTPPSQRQKNEYLAKTLDTTSLPSPNQERLNTIKVNRPESKRRLSSDALAVQRESLASRGIRALFARASNLIREALHLDGIIFVDACSRETPIGPGKLVSRGGSEALRRTSFPLTPSSDLANWPGDDSQSSMAYSIDDVLTNRESDTHRAVAESDLLGYSFSGKLEPSERGISSYRGLPQSTIGSLLRQYSHGHIFEFDEDGTLEPRDEPIQQNTKTSGAEVDESKLQVWARQVIGISPKARKILFFPLWDPQRDQWFAGGFAWTNDPTKTLITEDLTYLAAFASCIMAEKSRLDALLADRAKSDFISSVSHELRSPLHGVLASAEALQHTSTGFVQDDMIRSIKICGEVLLDTMDHILDYAKMSNTKVANSSHAIQNQQRTEFDLSNLVENVIEGILAGKNYRKSTFEAPGSRDDNLELSSYEVGSLTDSAGKKANVMVILSIDWQASWICESQVGGWKRIIMNLLGNALKYTDEGFVHISLQAEKGESPNGITVTLQIEDSGRGISENYLKYELYTPFAQEDPLSIGTGLGLSIVKQLVTDFNGNIDIQSELGYGTEVKVSVPLVSPTEGIERKGIESEALITSTRARCTELVLCLVGFLLYPDLSQTPTGILTAQERRILILKSSIAKFASDWFGMNTITANTFEAAKGDVLICLQSQLDASDRFTGIQPLIVFEDVVRDDRPRDSEGVYYLLQPVGPHKLARILQQCADYRPSASKLERYASLPPFIGPPSPLTPEDSEDDSASSPKGDNPSLAAADSFPFQVDLPMHPAQPCQVDVEDTPSIDGEPKKPAREIVLLVEDNIINMKILVNYMKRANQQYLTASNGLEALQKYQDASASIKVIFMDISMPIMDGLTSTRHIRVYEREKSLSRVRIVALTCFSSEEYQRDAFASGIDLFLIKPVPMKTLQPILDLGSEGNGEAGMGEGEDDKK